MEAANPVTVQHLGLKGDTRHRDGLLASLDDARWPAAHDRAYVIIRTLEVQAPWWQAAEQAGQSAQDLASHAVSGWSAQAADAAAVRFEDLADLLACLSRDLASGLATHLWFWRAWERHTRLSAPEAVTRLWCDHLSRLPDTLAVLRRHRALLPVCALLQPPQLAELLDRARRVTGWPLPLPRPEEDGDAPVHRPRPLAGAVVDDWRPLLHALPPAQARAWLPLAALVGAWSAIPHLLHDEHQWRSWYRRFTTVCLPPPGSAQARSANVANPIQPPEHAPPDVTAPAQPADPSAMPSAQAPAAIRADLADDRALLGTAAHSTPPEPPLHGTAPSRLDGDAPLPGDTPRPAAPPPSPEEALIRRHTPATEDLLRPADSHPPTTPPVADRIAAPRGDDRTPPDASSPLDHATSFNTAWGGLFYLLNVLSLPVIARALESAEAPGWHRLYRLGLSLGLDADPPLARFLARRLNLEDSGQLSALPALADEARLLALARRHYAHLQVWDAALLCVPAEVWHTRSHLDVYYPLSAVRLEVRRAGLDIDPGWLPGLGQVVRFHYRDGAESTGDRP